MTRNNAPGSKFLALRRAVLLASVTGVGIAALAGGMGLQTQTKSPTWIASAAAAETAAQPRGFADLVEKVKPAVISVRVQFDKTAQRTNDDEMTPFRQGSPFERFFRQFGFEDMPNGMQNRQFGMPQIPRTAAEGSGFFISADGYAVTNNHVVNNAKTVQVITDDGKTLAAKVIGTDPNTDLALIKVDGNNFAFVNFADHDPRIGDWVVAVGNPFGLGGTVTAGVVSARGRNLGSGANDFIQIDAPINRGNSGGPTFDLDGNVIGVNTAIYSPSGGSVGIGFDIPADTAKMVVAQLRDKGHVTRGWLGVRIQPVTADIADSLGLKKAAGALVDEPQSGSPAGKAGILAGDVITAVDDHDVKDSRDLARQIGAMAPGTSAKLSVWRKGEAKTVTLTIGELSDQRQANADQQGTPDTTGTPRLGLTLAPASDVGGAGNQGVAVMAVDPNGPAAEHGIKTGDVILDIAGKTVSKPEDVREELANLHKDGKHSVLIHLKSGAATRFVAVPFAKA
ncbi:MAG TPA: Do family serine endopeptidase [Xanthobacteraceae bacterium]|nr:Do family serine endopeptidase [Xanthobacteraceae bacterium]